MDKAYRAKQVTDSLEAAAERAGDITPLVYQRLFHQQPQMEALFWNDKSGAIKGEMLARVIEAVLDFLGDDHYAGRMLQSEVITHAGYDVPPQVFATFFTILAETLADILGPDWTADMGEAWRSLLAEISAHVVYPYAAEPSET